MNEKRIHVDMMTTPNKASAILLLASEDGSPLEPQEILDAVTDYIVLYDNNWLEAVEDESDDGLH